MVQVSKILSDKKRGISCNNSEDYIKLSRKGLTIYQLRAILKYTGITIKEISKIISITEYHLESYPEEKILRTDISAQLIQILDLYTLGYEVFEDTSNFQQWMRSEIRALDFEKPISLLDTPFGINDVKQIIGRIEHGVYS